MTDRISIVTPVTPGGTGGLTDYANLLAERMGDRARVVPFDRQLTLDGDDVLLNYVGYGYAARGVPLHLLSWLRRHRPRMRSFGVFFHETYASGPPTSSIFWLSPLQRYIAIRLATQSDFWISNLAVSTAWLQRHAGTVPHECLPVFSNVGEPDTLVSPRDGTLIAFGSEPVRALLWREAGEALLRWAAQAGLEVHDIGAPIREPALAELLHVRGVKVHGRLPASEVSARMGSAAFGAVSYPSHCVGKSGIFAAYCAHGMVPVLLSPHTGDFDGVAPGRHYLKGIPADIPSAAAQQAMSQAAYDWYRGHDIAAHARVIGSLLQGQGGAQPPRRAPAWVPHAPGAGH